DGLVGVDLDPAGRFSSYQAVVAVADALVEFQRWRVHPVPLLAVGTAAGQAAQRVNVQVQRQVRLQAARRKLRDLPDGVQVEATPIALVGQRTVGKAITQHDAARCQVRTDALRDQL